MKKFISILLVGTMLMLEAFPLSASADEVYATRGEIVNMLLSAADDYNPQVREYDIIHGYGNGNLGKDKPVTKAEALIMLKRAFGDFPEIKGNNKRIAIPKEQFSDIPQWAEEELAPIFDAGIVAGTGEGKFSPNENITKAQMETIIKRTYVVFGTNIKDNFYAGVNKDLLDTKEIKPGDYAAGTIDDIYNLTNEQIKGIIQEAAASNPAKGSNEDKIKTLYENIINLEARNAAGYEPIKNELEAIDRVKNLKEFEETPVLKNTISALDLLGTFYVTIDAEDSNIYIPSFVLSGANEAREMYNGDADKQKQAYINYITKLLELCGEDKAKASKDANLFFETEKKISDVSLTPDEEYDVDKTYNIYTLGQLKNTFKTVDFEKWYARYDLPKDASIEVMDVGRLNFYASFIDDDNIEEIKNFAKISLILTAADYLSEDFIKADNDYKKEAFGIDGEKTVEEIAIYTVSDSMYDYVGKLYAEKYCSEEMVREVTQMTKDILNVYCSRINNLTWMSEATKKKAILKLDTMRINVGAPDYSKVESPYDNIELKSVAEGGSYYDNFVQMLKCSMDFNAKQYKKPVDKTQWITTPQTVNAFYAPPYNSINFPAAFMQEKVYSKDLSYEEKLGAIGFLIGHEITHAFDSDGAKYDEKGNAVNWWTSEDEEAFKKLCDKVVEYYDGQEAAPGITMNGELTLSENIADLGAMACITELGKQKKDFDFKKMYESNAVLWGSTMLRGMIQNYAYIDTHSADVVRVTRVVQSVDEFYDTFDIDENDGMYIPKEERVRIW